MFQLGRGRWGKRRLIRIHIHAENEEHDSWLEIRKKKWEPETTVSQVKKQNGRNEKERRTRARARTPNPRRDKLERRV